MASTTAGDGDEALPSAFTDLNYDLLSVIALWLPTRDAYRLSAVCQYLRRPFVKEPQFVSKHLSPRPLPPPDGGPDALAIQPQRRVGYTLLTRSSPSYSATNDPSKRANERKK